MNKMLVALLARVAVGLLIAPDKGSAARAKIMNGFNDLADNLEGVKNKFVSDVHETLDDKSLPPKMSPGI